MAVGGLVLGAGALWLLSQFGKGKVVPKNPAAGSPDALLAKLTGPGGLVAVQSTFVSKVYDQLAANPVAAIISGVSTFAGLAVTLASVAGIGIAAAGAYVALAVIVVVLAAIYITAGVTSEQWQSNARTKGQTGLLDDYVKVGSSVGAGVAQGMIDSGPPAGAPPNVAAAWPVISKIWAAYYATYVLHGYNQVSQGVISFWGGDTNNSFSDRAMFLRGEFIDDNRDDSMQKRIFAEILPPAELAFVPQFSGAARQQASQWGQQFGRILWIQLFARGTMLEPWQRDWFVPTSLSGLGIHSGYGTMVPCILMMAGLTTQFSGFYGPSAQICNYDAAGNPLVSIPGVQGGVFNPAFVTTTTVAPPFVVDWTKSSAEHLEIGAATKTWAALSGFGDLRGRSLAQRYAAAGGRFKQLTRGRYGR